ncbi:hypothetical protein Hanom_Chr01g00042591 [Helianthus anomalus]
MVSSSTGLVSKARTTFHSTATKAKKVFTDIKQKNLILPPMLVNLLHPCFNFI